VKVYDTASVRNVAVAGHGGSGKTTLVSAALFTAGAVPRRGRVEEGNTVTDFDEEEIHRRITITSALAFAEWNKSKINFIDTPGYNILIHEAEMALSATESVLIVVDAVAGVEVQTEKVWSFAARHKRPVIFVVNRMDRERADAERALESLKSAFGRGICAAQAPIGSESSFSGVVDLVGMKAYSPEPGGSGRSRESDIPAAVADAAKSGHEALVELVAEGDDALLEEFFEKGTIPVEHLGGGLRSGIRNRRIFPVLFASAGDNIGVDALLSFLADFAPNPAELGVTEGFSQPQAGDPVRRPVADDQPLSLFCFKTMADPFAGRVSYLQVRTGCVKTDATVTNFTRGSQERLAHLSVMQGKQAIPVTELHAGDIGAVAKLRDTLSGDTLGDKSAPTFYRPIPPPEPAIQFAIEAKSRGDEDKLGAALHKMLEEDLALQFLRDPQTKEFLLAGTGQQHVEIAVARLRRRYHVDVNLKAPKVPYRETIRGKADVQGRYKKQTGGHGQYGDCKIRMEPLPRGSGFQFVNEIFGGAIPKNYIPAVEKGIIESAGRGYLAGFPVVDFRVVLYDGSYHDVDSSELAFKVAGSLAFKKAMEQARPVLLEPIMEVEVQAPQEFAGDLIGDLNGRRGRIEGLDVKGDSQIIRAQVPMSEMLAYQSDLTSKTQGRGSFHMNFSHYDVVPAQQADKIVANSKLERGAAPEEEA
jgi:elongation factor G